MFEFDIVDTELGKVRGVKKVSALETPYTAFLGVPYAKAPLGELRFKVSKFMRCDDVQIFNLDKENCLFDYYMTCKKKCI